MTHEFKPSAQQAAYLNEIDATGKSGDNIIMVSCAGSGKSTTLIQGARRMVKHGSVLLMCFAKKARKDLVNKIKSDDVLSQYSWKDVKATTLHSHGYATFAKRDALGRKPEREESKLQFMTGRIFGESISGPYALALADTVDFAKQHCFVDKDKAGYWGRIMNDINDETAWHRLIRHYNTDSDINDGNGDFDARQFVRRCIQLLRASTDNTDMIDYADMIYMPLALDWRPWTADFVLLDECQDSNAARRILAFKCVAKGGRFVAVGDPRQAIMGFAGADCDAMDLIEAQAPKINRRPIRTMKLSDSFRCPQAVVRHINNLLPDIEINAVKGAPEGEVLEMPYDDAVEAIANAPRHSYKDIAVLCRLNRHLAALAFALIRRGVPARMEGRAIGEGLIRLARRWKTAKTTADLRERLGAWAAREIEKLTEKKRPNAIPLIEDQAGTLNVIIDEVEIAGGTTVDDVVARIDEIFADTDGDGSDNDNANVVTLCSAHRSKGLEWQTVYLLGRTQFMPHRMATTPEAQFQEQHLVYVSCSRAKFSLIEVQNVPDGTDSQ